ncbi:secreted RxLR effector protein 161-like [Andrographis paniculata]|uniref:secreted RxLR effector protein 161-like n=1 Tax=Andrographis paniculata TaxID=175694 RepID=UPI0021E84F9A|nr:secreted RxLR effector protein 161-like [Andrographis paniculata]
MDESKSMATPMESCLKLSEDGGKLLEDATAFRKIVGNLFYLTVTRPNISYSVGVISQFMDEPCESPLAAAKRIFRYIKDANWACDISDRRSMTGYCFTTSSAAISWCSNKQPTIALSSCEAEYVAATMATQECLWLKRLFQELM